MSDPGFYASHSSLQRRDTLIVTREFEEDLAKINGICMDIGCGPGTTTKDILLPTLGKQSTIVGTDINTKMIDYAKLHSSGDRLTFEVLDIETKDLPEKHVLRYDHMFSFFTLQWCLDFRKALENIYQMLRPGGTILFVLPCHHDIHSVFEDIINGPYGRYVKNATKYSPIFCKMPDPDRSTRQMMKEAGFEVIYCSHRDMVHYFQTQDDLINMYLAITALNIDVPKDVFPQYKEYFSEKLLKTAINCKEQSSGKEYFLDKYTVLICFARKI